MRKRHLFLLLFTGVLSFGTLCTTLTETSLEQMEQGCIATDNATSEFLMCVGIPSDPGAGDQQILYLKGLIDALLDVFDFMNLELSGAPLLNVSAGLSINSAALLQNDDIIRAWLQIRMFPMLSSISQNFLTCLSYNNFSCQTYQTIVQELSQQFSSLDPQKQQWIYSYFMQPFLSRNSPAGCMLPGDTTEDWITKNFGPFSVMAHLIDFVSINGSFNWLDVLHLLSPEQKAQLMLYPETAGLNNDSLGVVLNSLMSSLTLSGDVNAFNSSTWDTGFPVMYSPSSQDPLTQAVNGIMTAFRPVGSFVREFVTLTHQQDLSQMRSATLIQAMLNWTLAELAAPFKNISNNHQMDQLMFDPTDVNSWFTHVVVPILNRYLPSEIPNDLTAVFHNVFYLENTVNETKDICSVTLDGMCGVNNMMEHIANILQCAASTNLTLTQETVTSFILHLSNNLNTLLNQLANTNFSSEDSPFKDILQRFHDPAYVDLTDEAFITMWFNIKLKPLFPTLTPEYLLCLSAKPFSCQTFEILVKEMSNYMFLLAENGPRIVYEDFIVQFLLKQSSTGACMHNSSYEWIVMNLGGFSTFATVQEMYLLNPGFNALEAFNALTLNQIAEIIIEDLPQLPDTEQLIDIVFSNILSSPTMRHNLPQLILIISNMNMMKNNCMIYEEMFSWLHFASLTADTNTEAVILSSSDNLMKTTPADCVSYSVGCNISAVNESTVCEGVNSSPLMAYLTAPHNGSQLCSFSITEYACAQFTDLPAVDLATVLSCNLRGNNTIQGETWKVFIMRISPIIGPALDLFTNKTFQFSVPLVELLDVISDQTFSTFSPSSFTSDSFIQLWFGERLRPFLPYTSQNFLSCISTYNYTFETYQSVVKILSEQFDAMTTETQLSVYVYFIHTFLSFHQTPVSEVQSSDWLKENFGPFAAFATISELQSLNPALSVLDVLDSLTLSQLVQVSSSPEFISTPAQVTNLMSFIPDSELGIFFTQLSATLTLDDTPLVPAVSNAFLQQVFERVDLGDPTLSDYEVEQWINFRLQPFISNIQPSQISLYFSMITQRSCSISLQGVELLNSAHSSLSSDVLQVIYNQLINSLKGPELMNCYANQSYYAFLQSYFMNFQFPPLSTFLSLLPPDRRPELLNSISPAELSEFLNHNGSVDSLTDLCQLFTIYNQTETYLQTEQILSSALAEETLQCVWPIALSASSQSDVDRWFNVSLVQYLPYLSAQLVSSAYLAGASCFTFSKFVSVLGNYNFGNLVDFTKQDIYATIQAYLTTETPPKCYNPSDPALSSTAWFYQYIGVFITFITLDDLETFGGIELEQFTPNPLNIQLFANNNVSEDVITVYANMLYDAKPDISITLLPIQFWCSAPASAFSDLPQSDVGTVVKSLTQQCTDIDPTVTAALASNVDILTSSTIIALGSSITGLSVGQIAGSSASTLNSTLSFLSSVGGWSHSQALAIIQSLLSAGFLQITTVQSLLQLGSLLTGLPSALFNSISAASLLNGMQNQTFINNIIASPITTQQTVVNQIISVNSSSDTVVQNVPDSLAPLIPRTSLLSLSQQTITTINQKQWTYNQAILFFDIVADGFSNADGISFQVLQGFTCTRIQKYSIQKVRNLIRGCRRRGMNKVKLQESQLTCMYSYVQSNTVTVYTDYPAEMLLYYNLSQVQPSVCQAYYSALGYADFSVFSSDLAFKKDLLFTNALQCLGISGLNVNQTQLDIMGQMVCLFNSPYILNSDPYVLEKLKLCSTLTGDQSSAIETVLLSGKTIYGAPASWNQTSLTNLGALPLYLSSNFWAFFTQKEKVDFLRAFVPQLKTSGISRRRIQTLISAAGRVSKSNTRTLYRFRRDTACTVGEITQIQASDDSFPFGYDVNQFNACLSVQTLKDNLAEITDKATGSDYQQVILAKLNQAYPAGLSDAVLQSLGPASRAASASDISNWNVTSIETLTALMRSYDGTWSPEQVNAIVNRYVSGNRILGPMELNALGGANLCALSTNMLKTITSTSLQLASALSLSNCSTEQQQVLFSIAQLAFGDQTLNKNTRSTGTVTSNSYQLIQSYLSGADLSYVRTLSVSNISMDVLTFVTLQQNVINNLTVGDVQGLLGNNLASLKTYENNTVVSNWISRQLQMDLDMLNIGLTGGRASPTATTASANTNTTASANTTTSANTTASTNATPATTKPTGAGSSVSASSGLQKLLFLLGVTMATLQLNH